MGERLTESQGLIESISMMLDIWEIQNNRSFVVYKKKKQSIFKLQSSLSLYNPNWGSGQSETVGIDLDSITKHLTIPDVFPRILLQKTQVGCLNV